MTVSPSPVSDQARLAALYEVSRTLGASLNLDEALVAVMDAAIRLMGAERGYLVLRGAHTDRLEFCITRNAKGETLSEDGFEVSRSTAEEVIRTGQPVLVGDAQTDERTAHKDSVLQYALRSILIVPLRTQGEIIGVMYLDNKAGIRLFGEEDLALLQTFADQAAVAVANARLFEAQKQETETNRALLEIARLSQSAASVDELMQTVGRAIPALVGSDHCSLFLWDEMAGGFRPAYFSYEEDPALMAMLEVVRPDAVPLAREVHRQPSPFVVSPGDLIGKLPSELLKRVGTQTFVVAPIRSGEQVLGALILDNSVTSRLFAPRMLPIAEAVSHQLATTIQRLHLFETVQHHVDELTLLHRIATTGTQAIDEDALIENVTALIGETFFPDNFGVILIDRATGILRSHASYRDRFGAKPRVLPVGRGITGRVAATGQPRRVPDVRLEPDYVADESRTQSELCVPLKVGGRVIGVINAESARPAAFSAADERLLVTIAGQLATAIEKLRLLKATEQRAAELDAVRRASLTLTSSLDLHAVLNALLESVLQLVSGMEDAHIVLYQGGRLAFGAALRADGRKDDPYREPRPEGLTYTVARTGQPLVVPNMRAHPLFAAEPEHWQGAIVGLPLKIGERVVGVMNVAYTQPRRFEESELRLLGLLGDQAAGAIENARLFEAAQRQLKELTVLHAVATAGTEAESEDALVTRVTRTLGETLYPDDFGVMFLDDAAGVLRAHPSYHIASAEAAVAHPPIPVGQGITGRVAATGQPWRVLDVTREPAYLAVDARARSELCVPLKIGERIIGVVNAESHRPEAFTEADERLLITVAGQLATAIEKLRLFEAERTAREQAETLREVASTLNTSLDREELLQHILEQLARVVPYDSASVMLLAGRTFQIVAQQGFRSQHQHLTPFDLEGLQHLQELIRSRQPLIIPDVLADPRWSIRPSTEYIRCWLGVPLIAQDQVIGLLNLDKEQAGFYTERHATLAVAFANQAAVAIENAQLYAETQRRLLEQTLLYEGSQALTLASDVQAAIVAVTERMVHHLDATSLSFFAYDEASGTVRVDYEYWTPQATPRESRSALGQVWRIADYPRVYSVLQTRLPHVLRRSDPALTNLERDDLARWDGQTAILVPMAVHDHVLGYFEIWDSHTDAERLYGEADLSLLLALANQAAVVVERLRLLDQTRQRERELALLLDVARAISSSLDFDQVMRQVAISTAQALRMEACGISTYEPGAQHVYTLSVYSVSQTPDVPLNQHYRLADYPATARVLESGEPIVVQASDPEADPAEVALLREYGYGTLLMFPLRAGGRVVGLAELYTHSAQREFTSAETHLARALADQAGVAIENARLFQAERDQRELAEALRQVGTTLSATLDYNTVLDRLLEHIARVVPYDSACMMMVEGRRAHVARIRGYERFGPRVAQAATAKSFNIPATANLRRMSETGRPLVIPDTHEYPGWEITEASAHIRSWAGAPVVVQGELIAFFSLDKADANFYRLEHGDRLAAFVGQAALALQNARLFEAEHRRVAVLTALHETALDLSAQLDIYTLLQTIVERAVRLMDASMGGLYLFRPDGQALELKVGYKLPRDYTGIELKPGEGVAGRAAQLDKPLVIGSYANWPGRGSAPAEANWESVIGVPIKWRERVLGVIVVVDEKPHRFQPSDAEMVGLFADKAAVAIVNARLFEETRRQTRELVGLYGTALATSSVLDTKALLAGLYEQVDDLMAPDSFGVALYDAETEQMEFVLAMERERVVPEVLGLRVPVNEGGLIGWVVRTRQPLLIGDLGQDPLPVPTRHITSPARAWLGAPLIARDHVIGAVTAQSFRPQAFDESDLRFLESAARQVAVALENARLFEALVDEKGRLELLYTLSQNLTASLDPGEVAARALDLIRTHLGATKAEMFVLETGSDLLHLIAISGVAVESLESLDREMGVRLGQGLAGHTALTRALAIVPDVAQDGHWITVPRLDEGVRSAAAVPLMVSEELVGVLNLLSDRENFFRDAHLPILRAVAAPVALALQNARLYQAEARRAHHLALLNKITRTALELQDLPALLNTLAEQMGQFLASDACYIALWDEAHQRVIPMAAYGPFHESYAALPPRIAEGTMTLSILREGRALVADDAENSPHISPELAQQFNLRSALGLPLIAGEQKLGAAIIAFNEPHHFTADEVARGEQAARQIALALAKARLLEEARRHADEVMAASEILRALNAAPDVNQAFPAIIAGLRAITGCTRVSLTLVDETREWFTVNAVDPSDESNRGARVPVSSTSAAADVLAGRPHLTPDLEAERDTPFERALSQAGYRSRLNLPLHAEEQVVGSLNLVWLQPNGYNPAHLPLLGQVADAVALAVEKKRLFDETRRRADELETVSRLSAVMRLAESTGEIMQIVLTRSLEVFHASSGAIVVPGTEPGTLVVEQEAGWPVPLGQYVYHLDDSIFGHVFSIEQPYLSPDLSADPLAHTAATVAMRAGNAAARTSIYAPIRTSGAVIGIICVSDLSPRIFTQADLGLLTAIAEITGNALRRSSVMETLEQRVAARTRELADANERLKELDRLKDHFVSNVSHELRTPITNLKLHLGLLEKRGPELLERYLPILQRETERLRRLIEDLLDLSRLQAQASPPRREPYFLDALLAEVVATHITRAESKGLAFRHETNPDVLDVPMDRAQMIQVFTNLIGNAVAYTPSGGHVTVTSYLAKDGPKEGVAVHVHNDRPTIPPDELPHLFDRFYRGSTAHESGEPGTGLGLSICREIVERHGGYVEVESREGEGTAFTVWLPLAP